MHKNRAGALRPRHDLIICVFVSTPTIDREPFYLKRETNAAIAGNPLTGVDRKAASVSSNSIRQEGQKSQEVFSACYFLRINIGHPFETKIGMAVLCFRKTVQLCHCEERSDAASAVCCDVENTKTRTQLNRNGTKCVRVVGTPEGTRTPDLLVRSQTLYPAELLAHGVLSSAHI